MTLPTETFQQQLNSGSPDFIQQGRHTVSGWLNAIGEAQLNPLVLLVSEWLTNLHKHSEGSVTEVRLSLHCQALGQEPCWQLVCEDNGVPFRAFDKAMTEADTEFNELKVCGMGLGLIKTLTDAVNYETEAGWNRLIMSLRVAPVERQRIAVIDDDLSLLALVEAYLADDYDVKTFASATDALAYLEHHTVSLVVSDVNMPGMDGIQFRTRVHALSATVPFVFLTGESAQQLYHLPIDDVLEKPVSRQRLLASVARVLNHQRHIVEAVGEQLAPDIVRQLSPVIRHQPPGAQMLLATRHAGGGGDLVFQLEDSSGDYLLLADVMGHDAQARFFVHAFHGYLYGVSRGLQRSGEPLSCGLLLCSMAEGMAQDGLLGSTLLTALALRIHNEDGRQTLQLASAGHPLPLQLTDSGWQALDHMPGPLLGFVGCDYHETEWLFEQPLLLYTDGLLEPLSETQQQQLLERLAQGARQTPASVQGAMDYYDKCVAHQPPDDVTVILVVPANEVCR